MGISVKPVEYHYEPGAGAALLGQKWIPRERKCVASARRFVRDIATDWSTADGVPDIAELLASEIVTNAVVHGTMDISPTSTIRIAVARDGGLLTVDVYDACGAVPEMRTSGSLEISGRGLAIVETLACDWGWNLHPHGKSVWFQLAAWQEQ